MPLKNGETFAGYKIIRLLGSGGMGEVYLAQHPRLPRRDALKLLPRDWSADPEYRARFNREADLASTLWHPHIVGVHDRGEEDGQLWISMDFVDGLDAARLLANRYPAGMPVEEVARIVTAVASALDYAHKQGLLHRDVKPANIMLTHIDDDGGQRILLTDFGIARDVNEISGLTATNMTVGTVAYSAPEQLLGEDIDGRTDQYALAATAYHLLTGSHLFPHSNPIVVSNRHINNLPPPLAKTRPELAHLDPILAVALAKDPNERFQRCSDFARALSEEVGSVSGGTSASAATRPAYVPKRSRRGTINRLSQLWPIAAAVGAVLILVLGVWAWHPWNPGKPPTGETTSTSPSSIPITSAQAAPPPPALLPSTSSIPTPTTTTGVDAYRYAVPGCYFNEDRLTERPTTFTFQGCVDGGSRLEAMSWSAWGASGAQGTGIFSEHVCEPNCAEGHRVQYAANVSAFNPRPAGYNSGCPTDVLFYSEMIVSFPASSPKASEIATDTTYLGRPAIRFTRSPGGTVQDFLGDQVCY